MNLKHFSNGDIYFGQLTDGHMEGLGCLYRQDEYLYIGKILQKKP